MKSTLPVATLAIVCAVAQLSATSVTVPLRRRAPDVAFTPLAGQNADTMWNGRWQGTTVSGQQLTLQLQLLGQRLAGRLTVGKKSAPIIYGKVVGEGFALTTGPIDGRSVDASGRQIGDAIELTIDGVKQPLTLTRVK